MNRFDGGPLHSAPMGAGRMPRQCKHPVGVCHQVADQASPSVIIFPAHFGSKSPLDSCVGGAPSPVAHRAHGSDRPTFCGMVHRTMQYGNFVPHLRLMFTPTRTRNVQGGFGNGF